MGEQAVLSIFQLGIKIFGWFISLALASILLVHAFQH